MGLWARWAAYWFRPAPLIDLALLRIALVGFELYLLAWMLHPEIAAVSRLPDSAWAPLVFPEVLLLPLGWKARPAFELVQAVFWIAVATGALALIGLWTRAALAVFSIAALFLMTYDYSYGDFHHPEALLHVALVALALAPAGAALSVDDLRARLRASRAAGRFEPVDPARERSEWARWPLLLVQWLLALAYLSAAFSKVGLLELRLDWMNGYTLRYFLIEDGLRWDSALSLWVAAWPRALLVAASVVSVAFEALFWLVLVFPRLALLFAPVGIGLHVGIYATLRAPFFGFIALYVAFVPLALLLLALRRRLASSARLHLYYDDACALCIRTVTLLQYFDWLERIDWRPLSDPRAQRELVERSIVPADALEAMHVLRPGEVAVGFFAVRRALQVLPLLWPLHALLRVPGAGFCGRRVYRAVAARRAHAHACGGACALHRSAGAAG